MWKPMALSEGLKEASLSSHRQIYTGAIMCPIEQRDMECSVYKNACEYVGSDYDKICNSTYNLKLNSQTFA